MTVSGCDKVLNVHFYSATSLKYHAQTLDMIPHPVTLSWPWVDQSYLYPVSLNTKRGAASTFVNDFGMSRPGIVTMTTRSPKQTLWATGAGLVFSNRVMNK